MHVKNIENGIKDTSNKGIYHNAQFLDCAIQYGLEQEEKTKKNGHGITKSFTPIYEAIVLQELQPNDGAFTLVRKVIEAKKEVSSKSV